MKNLILITALLLLSSYTFAQGKKDVKKYNIKSATVNVQDFSKGKELSFKESFIKFNKDGEPLEDVEYYPNGSVKRKYIVKYDNQGEAIEEHKTDEANRFEKIVSSYNADGDKVSEAIYDDKGTLLKKSTYAYDKKGLRTEKRTVDASGKLISIKTYSYEL